jgi:small-conductance mechanosensitive channel
VDTVAFFRSSFVEVVASAGTALLSLSFIFAATTQEFLGSCIFLFVKHPYDVGDRVDISGTQLIVERISLLYTMFHRTDKMQVTQVCPTSVRTMFSAEWTVAHVICVS